MINHILHQQNYLKTCKFFLCTRRCTWHCHCTRQSGNTKNNEANEGVLRCARSFINSIRHRTTPHALTTELAVIHVLLAWRAVRTTYTSQNADHSFSHPTLRTRENWYTTYQNCLNLLQLSNKMSKLKKKNVNSKPFYSNHSLQTL